MTTQAKGSASRLIMDFEQSYKTSKVKADRAPVILPFNSCEVKAARDLKQAQTLRGNRNPVDPYQGNLDVSGAMTIPVDMNVLGYLLKAAIGAPATVDNLDGTYTHTFKVGATAALPSFILEKGFTDLAAPYYQLYTGCKINTLEITFGGDGELVATVNVVGASNSDGTVAYDDASLSDALAQAIFGSRFNQFQASAKEGGVTTNDLLQAKLTINNNLDTNSFTIGGGGVRSDLPEGIAGISGSITALFKDTSLLVKAKANTESSLQIDLASGDDALSFKIPELKYKAADPSISGPAGIQIEADFEGYYADGAEASAVVATLTNTLASFD